MDKTILVIEDNPHQAEMLLKLIREEYPDTEVYHANCSENAYRYLMEHTVDVFFVDIVLDTNGMGDTSGICLAEKIREIPKYAFTPLIFVTSMEDPQMYAYKGLHCFGYVEKPFNPSAIKQLLAQAIQYKTEKNTESTLCFRKDGILYPVKCAEIIYIESINHVMHIHIDGKKELQIPYRTAKQILDSADYRDFLQCSRNMIINCNFVEDVDLSSRYITLKNTKEKISIGITYLKKVTARFH